VVGRLSEMGAGVDDGDGECAAGERDPHCVVVAIAAASTMATATGITRDCLVRTPAPFCRTKYHAVVYYSRHRGGWI